MSLSCSKPSRSSPICVYNSLSLFDGLLVVACSEECRVSSCFFSLSRSLPLTFPNSRPTSLFLISCLRKELQIRGHGQRPDRSAEGRHGASSRDLVSPCDGAGSLSPSSLIQTTEALFDHYFPRVVRIPSFVCWRVRVFRVTSCDGTSECGSTSSFFRGGIG